MTTTETVIEQGDSRGTKTIVQTIPVDTGRCGAGHGACGKPGVIAVRCTTDQQWPTEVSTYRVTVCAEHHAEAARMHETWVASARELLDPVKYAEFCTAAGYPNGFPA